MKNAAESELCDIVSNLPLRDIPRDSHGNLHQQRDLIVPGLVT